MLTVSEKSESERFELESKVLAAAFKQSIDLGDSSGADFAHKQLFRLLQRRQAPGLLTPSPARILLAEASSPAALQNEMSRHSSQEDKNAGEQIYAGEAAEQPNLSKLFSEEGAASQSFSNPLLNRQRPTGLISEIAKSKPQSLVPKEADTAADLSGLQPGSDVDRPDQKKAVEFTEVPKHLRLELENLLAEIANAEDLYGTLGTTPHASHELAHQSFIKRVRKLLMFKTKGSYSREVLAQLRNLWIAHDILLDPKARYDYDLQLLNRKKLSPEAAQSNSGGFSKIGELLKASGLLEPAELEIACDMHKAMPEMQFGKFLVKQGFVEEPQLRAVLAGQFLIRSGKLTIEQFQEVMTAVKNQAGTFKDILLEKGFCTSEELRELVKKLGDTAPKKHSDTPGGLNSAARSPAKISFSRLEARETDHEFRLKLEVKTETKITNTKLRRLVEEHEHSPKTSAPRRPRPVGETTYGEIDRIESTEIDPEARHDETD
jgi:hypothetical protein